jgi:formate dehydrogenase major subunit
MDKVHLTINDQPVVAERGQTILEAAKPAGIDIPTLCYHPAVSNHGACRLCLVEVKGLRGLQTACTCPVTEGMEVKTETQAVWEGRKFALELLFSERNHYCMYCQRSGDCELQDLAYRHGLDHWRFPRSYEKRSIDASHPYILIEPNRCVLCTRCVRACAEIAANHTLGLRERGSQSMICADVDLPLGASSCVGCGACVQVCPTGALVDRLSAYGGHKQDLSRTRTTCMQCGVGCRIDVVTHDDRLLRIEGVWDEPPTAGLLCAQGRFMPLHETRQRVSRPHVRHNGRLAEADWKEALALVAEKLNAGSVLGLAACATTDEALAAFAELFEKVDGHAGRVEPAPPELGYGTPAQVQDLLEADLIVVTGTDPLNEMPVVGYFVKRAADQGTQVALITDSPNGLADIAALVVTEADVNKVVALAAESDAVVVLYGTHLRPTVASGLEPLAGKVKVLAVDPARNGRGAAAAGLSPVALQDANVVYFLLGEQSEDPALMAQLNGAFTVVQASYHSPLTEQADVLLPAPIWAERRGHVTNLEGRVLPLNAAVRMPAGVRDDADVLNALINLRKE